MKGPAVALAFLTRIPVRVRVDGPSDLASSVPWFPVVGAIVGLAVGGIYRLGSGFLPALPAAGLAVATGMLVTGALHEDGLADTVDGLAGGRDRAARLEIMKDSRVGAFGALALVVSVLLRVGALAAFQPETALALVPLVHALARGSAVGVMVSVPAATTTGLGADYLAEARPWQGVVGLVLAGALAFGLAGTLAVPLFVAATVPAGLVAWWAAARIGGLTGDVLGACEQASEIGAFLAASAIMR